MLITDENIQRSSEWLVTSLRQEYTGLMQGGERYNSISDYLKKEFGTKTIKLSIDAGFTCPNRDGTCGVGGCAFCSAGGSGELASVYSPGSIATAIDEQIAINSTKWPDAKYLAYFQAHTNTYAPVEELRVKYNEALDDPRISGIVIATRPDCLPVDVLDLLEEINKEHFMWVELGLQTIHAKTSEYLGIGYPLSDYDRAVEELTKRGIKVVTHLILGLPTPSDNIDNLDDNHSSDLVYKQASIVCESEDMMFQSLRYVCSKPIWGLKLHLLNVVKGSRLYAMQPDYVSFNTIEEYVDLVVRCLELIPPEITIHRLTGDVPRNLLVSPEWSYHKRTILNKINYELKLRETRQGENLIEG